MNTNLFISGISIAAIMLLSLFVFPGENVTWIITRAGMALLGVVLLITSFVWRDGRRTLSRLFLILGIFSVLAVCIEQFWNWSIQRYPGTTIALMVVMITTLLVIVWCTTPRNLNKRKIAW